MLNCISSENLLSVQQLRNKKRSNRQSFFRQWGFWQLQELKGKSMTHLDTLHMIRDGLRSRPYFCKKPVPYSI